MAVWEVAGPQPVVGRVETVAAERGGDEVLDRGERQEWFDSPEIIIECALAILFGWIFLAHSLTSNRPFIDPRLLLDRNFALGIGIALVFAWLLGFGATLAEPALNALGLGA